MRLRISACIIFILLTLTILVYWPGLFGAYIFDDGPNITQNSQVAITNLRPETLKQAAFSSTSGPLRRPISMLSFAVNYYLTGFNPFYFKLTNLLIHLANGVGIFLLTSMLLDVYRKKYQPNLSGQHIGWVACATTAAWLLHPFNLTSVLYVVQRMASLSAFFSIWGLVLYCWGRARLLEGRQGVVPILASVLVFTPAAMLSKENGALLPVLMLVTELAIFRLDTPRKSLRTFIIGLFAISVAIPTLASVAYMVWHPDFLLSAYAGRDFNLAERVMTEARVMWFYIRLILLPSTTQMGLFHDDIVISRGLLQPATTLFSLMGIAFLCALCIKLRKKAPLVTFGILFFFAGHLFESTIFPFEIAHEHRNYLPMTGLIITMFFYILHPVQFVSTLRLRQIAVCIMIVLFSFGTFARATDWSNPFDLAISEVERHPESARNNSEMGNIYANLMSSNPAVMESNYQMARHHFEKATSLSPSYPNGLFGLILLTASRGKPVEPNWIKDLSQRLAHGPATANAGDQLIKLLACRNKKECTLNDHDLKQLIQATLRNPSLRGASRALALSAYTDYLVNIAKDYPKAIEIQKLAADTSPREFEHRLTLIKLLIALQHLEDADKQLDTLQQLDEMKVYASEIKMRKKIIENARKNLPGAMPSQS